MGRYTGKIIYGLKSAGLTWFDKLKEYLEFFPSTNPMSISTYAQYELN